MPFQCQACEGQTVSGHVHIWGSMCGKRSHLALQGRVSRRDPAVPMWWVRRCSCSRVAVPSRDPSTRCKEQQSGVTTHIWRAPPARATNPRTGGHRPKKRPLTTGIPLSHFLTWRASSSTPHWCSTRCLPAWYVGWWSMMSRCSSSWYSYAVACSVLFSLSCFSSPSARRPLVCSRNFMVSG